MKSKVNIQRRANPRKNHRQFSRARKRLRELERAISERHGCVPATDDADLYLWPVANCFRVIAAERGKSTLAHIVDVFSLWCDRFAPSAGEQEIYALVEEALARPAKLIPDDIVGETFRFSYEERLRQKATTIGSYDVDRAGRKELAKLRKQQKQRLEKREKRRSNGAVPRAQYEANSLSQTQPWLADGICRRTWERRRKKAAAEQALASVASASFHLLRIDERRTCDKGASMGGIYQTAERIKRDGAEYLVEDIGEGDVIVLDGVGLVPPPRWASSLPPG
ncbi:hypothetical protein [Bradyrhizobium sp. 1200_D9_N1_1]|uniref:hypothetical protein n=1 Tax=Bradyrhizobium sp. 1200_D9_N1_1 TaxID=3239013 RepID=UPI003F8A52A6